MISKLVYHIKVSFVENAHRLGEKNMFFLLPLAMGILFVLSNCYATILLEESIDNLDDVRGGIYFCSV